LCENVHQTRTREQIHALPISGHAVLLKVPVCQFRTAWLTPAQQLGLTSLNRFAKTLPNWLLSISNYFVNRNTNGRTALRPVVLYQNKQVPMW